MTKRRVVILGSGGHAIVVWDLVRQNPALEMLGFADPNYPPGGFVKTAAFELPVIGGDEEAIALARREKDVGLVLGIGPGRGRSGLVRRLSELEADRFVTLVHPRAIVAPSCALGCGTAVMAGAVLNPLAQVGRHSVVNTGATVDHECCIGDNVFIQPGAHLAGRVTVLDGAVVGMGANVFENCKIGQDARVGGGALVRKDVPDGQIVVGVPARLLRSERVS